jgi:signal peptidase I
LNYLINLLIELLSVQLVKVRGTSMEPAIGDGSWVISVRAGFRRRPPQRFDVVRLEEPGSAGHWILKRVVGLPGEEVSLREGDLYVNDVAIVDSFTYCPDAATDNFSWWPRDDEYVVLGDNRSASTDSRKFGVVSRSSLRGRIN